MLREGKVKCYGQKEGRALGLRAVSWGKRGRWSLEHLLRLAYKELKRQSVEEQRGRREVGKKKGREEE